MWASIAAGQSAIPHALRNVTIEQKLGATVPLDAQFRNEHGQTVRLRDFFARRPVILSLVYYECPMLCTMVLNGLVKSLRTLSLEPGRDFDIVTISFDPAETPALARSKKGSYVRRYARAGAGHGWHFLTGDEANIRAVANTVGFHFARDPSNGQWAHASGIMVLTPQGRVARYLYGIEYSARDLRLGLVEASNNRIGSVVDQILLYCFHYDPVKGKYGLAIMRTIRAAGIATLLAIGTFLIVMFRRERRHVS